MNIRERIKTFFANGQSRRSLVALTFLALIAGFWAYSRYSKINPGNPAEPVTVQTNSENTGSISGGSIGPEGKIGSQNGTVAGVSTDITKNQSSTKAMATTTWTARQIERNSIKDKTYTVAKGDTLWQIAQGKYGSGFEWKKILEANKDKIGFLPDGSQALIEIGQELSLP